jgi:hypothetical protein
MKSIIFRNCVLLIALVFLISGAYGDIQTSFGATNMGNGVESSSTLSTQSTGSYSSTSSLASDSGVTLTESTQSSSLDIGPQTDNAYSTDGKNYAELYWWIKNPTNVPTVSSTSTIRSTSDSISLSKSYSFSFADEAIFRATAVNWKGYKAEVKSDIVKGGIKMFSHQATASNSQVSASQKLDDVWADTITREWYAKGATSVGMQRITIQTTPASSSRTSDFLTDSATATSSKITITPKPPTYPYWPRGPGWPF